MSTVLHYIAAHWSWTEFAGVTTTVAGIWLATRRSLWCWPITLIADVLYLVVFYGARLYSDSLLQVFFVVFTLYGWWNWWRGKRAEGEVRVASLPMFHAMVAVAAGVAGTFLLGALAKHVHAALPYLDACLASFSLVASWWQARRQIANWWLWIVVDILYVGEYIYKDLWPTAILYAGLVVLAIMGLVDWSRAAREAVPALQYPAPGLDN